MKHKNLTPRFDQAAASELPDTIFAGRLKHCFKMQTALKVLDTFQQLGLPLPEQSREYFASNLGSVIFSNRYGVTIRIEHKQEKINDVPWVVPLLASIDLGNACIEIYPGCRQGTRDIDVDFLRRELKKYNIHFWDDKVSNYGLIPIKSARFPIGIPVVIDSGAVVRRGRESTKFTSKALQMSEDARDAIEAQQKLYGPLIEAFQQGGPDPEKMKIFWNLCEQYVREKKLVTGWNTEDFDGAHSDSRRAAKAAQAYDERLAQYLVTHSTALAIPQSPLRPV